MPAIAAGGWNPGAYAIASAADVRTLRQHHDPKLDFYLVDFIGGEGGTQTLDIGIMRPADQKII
jgi:hypothetical protein